MQPNTNYQTGTTATNMPGTHLTGTNMTGTSGTNMTGTGMTGTNTGMTGTNMQQQPRKEGMVDKVKDMVGLGHKDHTAAGATAGATAGHGHHHGIVPPGAPSKEDHTLYKKGSSSSSSSSDEENTTRKERIVGTETLEQRGIPRSMPAEHVREGTTNLPVQRIPAPADALQSNVAIPTRMPSEHVYDERPGMYNGPTEYVNQGVKGMNLTGQKTVTATGAEADRLEQRDRAMGRPIEKDGAHTYAGTTGTGVTGTGVTGTGGVPLGNTGATMGGTHTTTAGTGTGLKEPLQGKMTGQKMHDSPAGVLGYGGATAKTDAVETNQAGGVHGDHHKPTMMEKVKGLLPGHHKH